MKKFIIIFSPIFITAIFVSFVVLKKTVKPSPSFQALTPSVGMNTTLKTASNTAVVEIKHDNSKLGLETPLKEVSLTKNNEEYVYQSIKDEMEIIYKPIDKGIKEEIILHKLPDLNKFSPPGSDFVEFSINIFLDNLSWGTNADDMPIFFDESGKYQFHFQKPFAKDAKGETTTSLVYKIIPDSGPSLPPKIQTRLPYLKPAITRGRKVINALILGINTKVFAQTIFPTPPLPKKKYTLVLSISKAWLSDSKRIFPVVIDPSVVNDPATAKPEIIGKRTANSRTFLKDMNDSSSLIGIFTIHDQNYQDENGNWQSVDESLGDNEDFDGYAYEAKSMKHIVKVGGDGGRRWYPRRNVNEYVEFSRPQYWNNSIWVDVPLSTPTRNENKITWDQTNYSLDLTVNWHRVKMNITLKNSAAARRVRWPVSLTGLTWDNWNLLSGTTVVGTVEKPNGYYLSDQADPMSDRIAVPVSVSYSGGYAEFTADLTEATYPVIIDPTFTTQPDAAAGIDAMISAVEATYNFGTFIDFWLGWGDDWLCRFLIKFDLTALPADAIISAATFSFYITADYADAGGTWRIYRQKRAWVEGTRARAADSPATGVTWNRYDTTNNWQTAGGFGADDCEQTDIGSRAFTATETINEFKDFSLTPTTKAGLDLGNGWLIKAVLESSTYNEYDGVTSDDATAAYRPKLVVDYTEAPSGPPYVDFEGVKMQGVKIN